MKQTLVLSAIVGAAVLSAESAAYAQMGQWRPERPNPGIYANGTDQAAQVLEVDGSVGTGFDTSAQVSANEAGLGTNEVGLGTVGTPLTSVGSRYNQFSGSLMYSGDFHTWSLGASFATSARQYPQLDVPITLGHAVSAEASVPLGRRTTLHGGFSGSFHSMRAFMPFAEFGDAALGQVALPNLDYGYGDTNYFTHTVDVGFDQQLSPRSTITGTYSQSGNSFSSSSATDLTHHTGSVRYTHNLTRNLSLRLGYGYTEARYGITERKYQTHNIDSGVDYSRALSLSRRTKLSFSTGATAVKSDTTSTQQAAQTNFNVIGSATLTREIGRTWNASLIYQRSVGYTEFILGPTFSDSVSASYGGLINRRLSFTSGMGASRGTVGFHATSNDGFDAVNAYAGLSQALTRHLALHVNYSFYRYNFEPGAALVTRLLPNMNRHSVNVTLSAWAPVFQHGRKSNAPR